MFESYVYWTGIGSLLMLFGIQLFLCAKGKHPIVRSLPFAYVLLLLGLAAYIHMAGGSSGGFIDLTSLAVVLVLIYAAICTAVIFLAKLVHWLIKRRKS